MKSEVSWIPSGATKIAGFDIFLDMMALRKIYMEGKMIVNPNKMKKEIERTR